MRDMLFRAKPKRVDDYYYFKIGHQENCTENGFVKGNLLINSISRYFIVASIISTLNCTINNAQATAIEVIPETVGQYTGLIDKNGDKIFEGDIVKCENYHGEVIGCISWIRGGGFYLKCTCGYSDEYLLNCKNIKIIGNIHDNPELLNDQ